MATYPQVRCNADVEGSCAEYPDYTDLGEVVSLQSGLSLHKSSNSVHVPSHPSLVEELSPSSGSSGSSGLVSPAIRRSTPSIVMAVITAFMICLLVGIGLRHCLRHSAIFQSAQPHKGIKAGIYGILFTQTLNALATMVVLPTSPFFAMKLGASALEVSLMNSAYNSAQMFCSPLMGALSDRFGRKRVMVLGIFAQMICNGFMTRAHTSTQLMMARMAVGVASSTGPVEMAYIMDFLHSEEESSRVLALQRVMTSAGALAGPLVARSFDKLPFNALCGGVVIINIVNLIVGCLLWEDAKAEKAKSLADMDTYAAGSDETEKSFSESSYMMFSNYSAYASLLVSFVYALGFAIGDGPEMVFFKDRYGFGKDQACNFYLLTNVSTLVCSAWVPVLSTNFGALTLCVAGSLGGALCTLSSVLGPVAPWVPYSFGASMVGLFGTMIGMGFMHLVRDYCPEDSMGTMSGMQSSSNGAAGALAPPLGGVLYRSNMFFPFLCTAAGCASTGLLYETTLQKEEPEKAAVKAMEPSVVHRRTSKLKRMSTFGRPIYHDKSFIVQVHANESSVEINPESRYSYQRMREQLREANVRGGMKPVATVCGPSAASIEQADERKTMDLQRMNSARDF